MVYTANGRMNVKEIRRENALALAESVGGKAKFARKMGWTTSRVSQIIGSNANRNIGDQAAKDIENAFGKGRGWLDQLHTQEVENPDLPGNDALLLDAMRAVKKEIRQLGLHLDEDDMDELICRATINLYRYTLASGGKELLPANIAILSLLPGK